MMSTEIQLSSTDGLRIARACCTVEIAQEWASKSGADSLIELLVSAGLTVYGNDHRWAWPHRSRSKP
jgi:hypothetical protein